MHPQRHEPFKLSDRQPRSLRSHRRQASNKLVDRIIVGITIVVILAGCVALSVYGEYIKAKIYADAVYERTHRP